MLWAMLPEIKAMMMMMMMTGIASFQPKSKGTYTIDVVQEGKAIPGSPFKINIDDHHVTSSQKVKVAGHIKDAMANQWNDVTVNIAEAGTPLCCLVLWLFMCNAWFLFLFFYFPVFC